MLCVPLGWHITVSTSVQGWIRTQSQHPKQCIIDTSGALTFSYRVSYRVLEFAYLQTLKLLPTPLNISTTPIHTKK